jgi:hypothetical protein
MDIFLLVDQSSCWLCGSESSAAETLLEREKTMLDDTFIKWLEQIFESSTGRVARINRVRTFVDQHSGTEAAITKIN